MILALQDFTYLASSLFLLTGYVFYFTGIVCPSWRAEIGYVYGLWVRCDRGVCIHFVTGLNHYLVLVRGAMMLGLIFLTTAVICLLTEMSLKRWMRRSSRRRKHLARLGHVISLSAGFGELFSAIGLAFYGYRTVLTNHKYPVLLWGVASTGVGVLLCLIASILRTMGPLRFWGQGLCCMAPPSGRRYKYNPKFSTLEARGYPKQLIVRDVGGVTSCCASQWSDECSSSTARSYFSSGALGESSDSRHYCHYEELSFPDLSDMPPPPPELLDQPAPQHPPLLFHMQPVVPYTDEESIVHRSQPLLHAFSTEGASGACLATATVCCHQPLIAGSSSTWHPQQIHHQQRPPRHDQIHQHEHQQQQIHTIDRYPYSTPIPQSSPHPAARQSLHHSTQPKAMPRRVRKQGAPPRISHAQSSRRPSGQSSRRPSGESSRCPSGESSRRPSVQSNRRQMHQPSGSASSMKSMSNDSPQIHRYQIMSVSSPQRHYN
ncbi:hypothetical protein ElyMa_000017200 [Elysia marginata]|uniref:Uncharacterized protein n=1 Tax=Elysia marginata TaxID=1093978 RepID=A0AAV4EB91_9GAST|nr:hypothetical protein ElyMa_000017200 [Elysia marginata]